MPRYRILHRTLQRYQSGVALSHHAAHLQPRGTPRQSGSSFVLEIDPAPTHLERLEDFFGNHLHLFTIQQAHAEMEVTATSEVEVTAGPTPDTSPSCGEVRAALEGPVRPAHDRAEHFLFPTPLTPALPEVAAFAAPFFPPSTPFLDAARAFCRHLHAEFRFAPHSTAVSTPLAEFFRQRRGVCQDFAHLALAGLRACGFPARYVSGYLLTRPPPGQPRLVGADASHAWISVFVPGLGWIDLDPTNDLVCGDQHITVAWGRDYQDITPLRGAVRGGGAQRLTVQVTVQPA